MRPVEKWPELAAHIHGLTLPSSLAPHAHPEPIGGANINILFKHLKRTAHLKGAVAECGVFRGGTLVPMAVFLLQNRSPRSVWGLDSFGGFKHTLGPEDTSEVVDLYKRPDGFSNTSLDAVQEKVDRFKLKNVTLVAGFFEDSLGKLPEQVYSFVHLDCDTYSAYRDCMQYFYPRMEPGGIIALDEYYEPRWPGCNQAVDEFMSDKPELIEQVVVDNYIKYAITKV